MYRTDNELSRKYYPKIQKFFGFTNKTRIIPVDFSQPWWTVVLSQKWHIAMFVIFDTLYYGFVAAVPAILGWLIYQNELENILFLVFAWIILLVGSLYGHSFLVKVEAQSMVSVQHSAVRYFLTVDPLFHSTRSSGQIIAKVNRASDAYEVLIDLISFDLLRIIIRLFVVGSIIINFDAVSGWFGIGFILFTLALAVFLKVNITKIVAAPWMRIDDMAKNVNLESLRENALVRSSFATPEQDEKSLYWNHKNLVAMATNWFTHMFTDYVVRAVYVIGMGVYCFLIFELLKKGYDTTLAISVLLVFFSGTQDMIYVGRMVERFTDRLARVTDLFEFIRDFGKQSYPVLPNDNILFKQEK